MKSLITIIIIIGILYFLKYDVSAIYDFASDFFSKLNHFQVIVYIFSGFVYLFAGWLWIDSINMLGESQEPGKAQMGDGYINKESDVQSKEAYNILVGTMIVDFVVYFFN